MSDTPGTTRDYLEAPLDILGVSVTAVDTAGIRDTGDAVEAGGVALAKSVAQNADLSLLLLDTSRELEPGTLELVRDLDPARLLVLSSKADLEDVWNPADYGVAALSVSATTGEGLDELRERVRERLIGDAGGGELWLGGERQIEALATTRDLLLRAQDAPSDLAALDLADALRTLGELTGRGEVAEETLEHIFANFCVGK